MVGGLEGNLADWVSIDSPVGEPLRCWWARPAGRPPRAGVLVLPEVFGVNGWVRRVAGRLAAEGYGALAVPLFSRTAPGLELAYDAAGLREGRSHKERTTTAQLLADLSLAADWMLADPARGGRRLGCVGFCFGGHVAMLAATLPQIVATCDFYGAGVASGRPGGGAPTLEVVPSISGPLLCLCGSEDPLIPPPERAAIAAALVAANSRRGGSLPHRLITLEGGHGFMCEERADHRPHSASEGWSAMLRFFSEAL